MLPFTIIDDSLIKVKKTLKPSSNTRIDAEQLARKVTPGKHLPIGRRVKSMIVARSQIDHTMIEAVLFRMV